MNSFKEGKSRDSFSLRSVYVWVLLSNHIQILEQFLILTLLTNTKTKQQGNKR